jgi:hypothetical protein
MTHTIIGRHPARAQALPDKTYFLFKLQLNIKLEQDELPSGSLMLNSLRHRACGTCDSCRQYTSQLSLSSQPCRAIIQETFQPGMSLVTSLKQF